jgi:hypothetical protein
VRRLAPGLELGEPRELREPRLGRALAVPVVGQRQGLGLHDVLGAGGQADLVEEVRDVGLELVGAGLPGEARRQFARPDEEERLRVCGQGLARLAPADERQGPDVRVHSGRPLVEALDLRRPRLPLGRASARLRRLWSHAEVTLYLCNAARKVAGAGGGKKLRVALRDKSRAEVTGEAGRPEAIGRGPEPSTACPPVLLPHCPSRPALHNQ